MQAPAGSLVLWDSRVVHQGLVPARGNQRIAVYVSYQPRGYATEADLARKRKCFDAYRMTTHAAAEGVQMFPKSARHMQPAPVPLETLRNRQTSPEMLVSQQHTVLRDLQKAAANPTIAPQDLQ